MIPLTFLLAIVIFAPYIITITNQNVSEIIALSVSVATAMTSVAPKYLLPATLSAINFWYQKHCWKKFQKNLKNEHFLKFWISASGEDIWLFIAPFEIEIEAARGQT